MTTKEHPRDNRPEISRVFSKGEDSEEWRMWDERGGKSEERKVSRIHIDTTNPLLTLCGVRKCNQL